MWTSTSWMQSLHVSISGNQSPALQTPFLSPSGLGSLSSDVSLPWGGFHTLGAVGRGPATDLSSSRQKKQVYKHLSILGLELTPWTSLIGHESQLQKLLMLTNYFSRWAEGCKCNPWMELGWGEGISGNQSSPQPPSTEQVGGGWRQAGGPGSHSSTGGQVGRGWVG